MNGKSKSQNILIVDDEHALREMLSVSLELQGSKTYKAANVQEALDIIEKNPIDIVLSDIRMPNGDGIELLKKAKKRNAKAPVVLLMTGSSEFSLQDAAVEGAEAIFLKPISIQPLMSLISLSRGSKQFDWTSYIDQTHVDIDATLKFANLKQAKTSRILSLGSSGMFATLVPEEYPAINAAVSFRIGPISGGSGETIDGKGVVRWARVRDSKDFPLGCGIEFLYISERHRKEIEKFLESTKLGK